MSDHEHFIDGDGVCMHCGWEPPDEDRDKLERELFDTRRMLGLYVAYAPPDVTERVWKAYRAQETASASR